MFNVLFNFHYYKNTMESATNYEEMDLIMVESNEILKCKDETTNDKYCLDINDKLAF